MRLHILLETGDSKNFDLILDTYLIHDKQQLNLDKTLQMNKN